MNKKKILIMGAAGRDFHNFNTYFRDNQNYEVVAFTATQIPDIADRKYPPELAGKFYPEGIPIYAEDQIDELIQKYTVDQVVFAYSDVEYEYIMHKSAQVTAAGADFCLMGTKTTALHANKPVIAVCAVRTGSGKSQVSRSIFKILTAKGLKVASIRHPMPYDEDLTSQILQRFSNYDDLDRYNCTIEEREEYEPYIDMGGVVYAGVDYEKILREAEQEVDVIIWDGGNNDFSFIQPDLQITIADPHRPGHELRYYPGEMNVRIADVVILNKVNTAEKKHIELVRKNIRLLNSSAQVIEALSEVMVSDPERIEGKRVVVIEDGPTVTHGNMAYGAGIIAAKKYGAQQIIDPRSSAIGSIHETFKKYHHLTNVLPAMGYGEKQISELEQTINKLDCDLVISGTPIDLNRVLSVNKPIIRVRYGVGDASVKALLRIVDGFLKKHDLL